MKKKSGEILQRYQKPWADSHPHSVSFRRPAEVVDLNEQPDLWLEALSILGQDQAWFAPTYAGLAAVESELLRPFKTQPPSTSLSLLRRLIGYLDHMDLYLGTGDAPEAKTPPCRSPRIPSAWAIKVSYTLFVSSAQYLSPSHWHSPEC
jgi:hypothetical protein